MVQILFQQSAQWICQKETKNWIDFGPNSNNWLLVDFTNFFGDQHWSSLSAGYY